MNAAARLALAFLLAATGALAQAPQAPVFEPEFGQEGKAQYIASKLPLMEREVRADTGYLDDAETVVVAFGTPAKFVKYAVTQLRAEGHRIGYVRPITLWPFPSETLREATAGVRRVGSFELSAGQLVDDVRIGVAGQAPVEHLGGVSTDHSGFGVGRLLDVDEVSARILALHEGRAQPPVPGAEEFTYPLAPHQRQPTPLPTVLASETGGRRRRASRERREAHR